MNRLTLGSLVLLALGAADLLILDGYFAPRAFAPAVGSGTVDPYPDQARLVARATPKPEPGKPVAKPIPPPRPAPEPAKPEPAPAPAPEPAKPEPVPEPAPEPAKPEPVPEPAKPEPVPEPAKPAPVPPPPKPAPRPPAPSRSAPIRLFFDTNQSEIGPRSRASLNRLIKLLKHYPSARVRIDGHADRRGEQKYNMELGQSRAAKVGSFLETRGIKPLRMIKRSFGSTIPLDRKDTPMAWARNRRTDIYLDTRGQK